LRGRCRACATPIPWRYPLVEATTAVLLAGAWVEFGPTLEFAVAAALLAALLAITVIDLRHQIIPRCDHAPRAFWQGSLPTWRPATWAGQTSPSYCAGGRIFFVIIVASRGGMGAGDMKLGAMPAPFSAGRSRLFGLMVGVVLGERGRWL